MDTQFIRDRISQLRIQKGVSEYQMSYDLGHSRSYIYNISSGKSLPPMAEFCKSATTLKLRPVSFLMIRPRTQPCFRPPLRSSGN